MRSIITILAAILLPTTAFCETVNLIINPSFETVESIGDNLPSTYGDWSGDAGTIVTSENGITPLDGSRMLRFDATSHSGPSESGTSCEVRQIIDISGFKDLILTGNAVAEASAYYNRVAGDIQTDNAFNFEILAFDGSPSTFPSRWKAQTYDAALAYTVSNPLSSDSNPLTWELCTARFKIPANTEFLVMGVKCHENIYNDSVFPEFDGHYADRVSFQIVPEPATIFLFVSGGVWILNRKRKSYN